MKTLHIIGIVVIAAAIGIIITSAGDTSKYVPFDVAKEVNDSGNDEIFHVVGSLKKNESGEIVGLTTGADKVSFSFVLVDENKKEETVYYNKPMPPDFTKSEKVVVVGNYKADTFIADNILLKCPSKYEEEKSLAIE